jgi:excisionase family DNA binding protein
MNKESIQDFRKRIETQNTAVLRRIWETEYRDEWTDEQFQVVKEILSKRGEDVSLSEQNSPLPLPDPTFSDSRIVPPDRYPNPQEGKKSSQWKNWSDLPLLLKIDEVADLLRIDVNEVEKLRQNGQLKANRIGDHWVFRRDEIKAFLDDVVLESKVSDNLPNFSTPTDYVSIDQPVKQKGKWGKVISVLASIGLLLLMSRNLVRVGQLYSRSGGAFTSLSPTATYQAVAPKKPTPIPTSSPSPMPKPTPTRAPTVRVKIM